MLSEVDKYVKEFFDIRHVEISGHHKVPASPVVLTQKGMNIFDAVQSVRSISQMPQPKFTGKGDIRLQPMFIPELFLSRLLSLLVFFSDLLEEMGYGLGLYRTISADIPATRFNIDFDIRHSGAILPTVVLLFHEDVHPVHGISRSVFFNVVG